MDLVDAFGVAARMEDTGSLSAVASKLHVRLSIAWRGAVAPINNGSPNSEMALTHYFQIFKSTDTFGRRRSPGLVHVLW